MLAMIKCLCRKSRDAGDLVEGTMLERVCDQDKIDNKTDGHQEVTQNPWWLTESWCTQACYCPEHATPIDSIGQTRTKEPS